MKQRDYYQLPKPSKLMRLLWKCAGGDRFLLERATYSDQIKYMCLGGVVFATGAMAGLAGGYAFYTIFSPKASDVINKTNTVVENLNHVPTDIPTVFMSVIFGIIWGLIIFNIDKFIVTSTGKGDGTEAITWDEFKGAIPRILMGMIIAITISKPIEIRMFQTEINLAVQKEQENVKNSLIADANKNFDTKVASIKKDLGKIQSEIDNRNILIMNLRSSVQAEIFEKGGCGPRCESLKDQVKILNEEINEYKKTDQFKTSQKSIAIAEQQRLKEASLAEAKGASLDGLLIRIKKAHEEAGLGISIFITLLFMAIELTPIFFKLMLTKTTYDYLAENRDELLLAENGIEIKYDYYKDKEGIERHLTINHEAEKIIFEKIKVTDIQKELTEYAVGKYKEREKNKIDNNLDDYIKSINSNEQNAG